MLSRGQESVTNARCQICLSFGCIAPGKVGVMTGSNASSCSIRAAARSLSSGVSAGTGRNVPEDCSPAMISAACIGSIAVSMR